MASVFGIGSRTPVTRKPATGQPSRESPTYAAGSKSPSSCWPIHAPDPLPVRLAVEVANRTATPIEILPQGNDTFKLGLVLKGPEVAVMKVGRLVTLEARDADPVSIAPVRATVFRSGRWRTVCVATRNAPTGPAPESTQSPQRSGRDRDLRRPGCRPTKMALRWSRSRVTTPTSSFGGRSHDGEVARSDAAPRRRRKAGYWGAPRIPTVRSSTLTRGFVRSMSTSHQ